MFESDATVAMEALSPVRGALTSADVAEWLAVLGRPDHGLSDAERIDQIRLLEELKGAAAAAQAVLTVDFATSRRAAQRAVGMPAELVGRGVAAEVAFARRESPHRGSRLVGLAQALVGELPATFAALQAGRVSEWRATVVARETACLSAVDRRVADAELGPRLEGLGDRAVEAEARRVAYRLDPHAFTSRTRGAAADRRVSLRPAPDTMCRLGGFLPVAQGVAAYAALRVEADRLRAAGDSRGRGQIMADTLVQRVTGQASAGAVPVEVAVVMTDRALLDGGDEPAEVIGYGPVPAPVARGLVRDGAGQVWLRRLVTGRDGAELVGMESRRRTFPPALRRFLVYRDRYCRTPWCGAPIRHSDHVVPVGQGGPTSADNGQALCQACNHAKQAPGWTARASPGAAGRAVATTTPTGHTYTSHPPPAPGRMVSLPAPESLMERHLGRLLDVA